MASLLTEDRSWKCSRKDKENQSLSMRLLSYSKHIFCPGEGAITRLPCLSSSIHLLFKCSKPFQKYNRFQGRLHQCGWNQYCKYWIWEEKFKRMSALQGKGTCDFPIRRGVAVEWPIRANKESKVLQGAFRTTEALGKEDSHPMKPLCIIITKWL